MPSTQVRKQDGVDPVERLIRLLDKAEPQLARRFVAVLRDMKNSYDLSDLERLIAQGRYNEALATLEARAGIFGSAVNSVFVLAGQDTARFMQNVLGIVIDFNQVNSRAVSRMSQSRLRLVREFTQEQRRATQLALVDGINRGANPRQQARAFVDSIGLTQQQQQSVNNFRRLLETNSRDALTRRLRDRRFDPTLENAIASDTPLTGDQIDRMVQRYGERFLQYRSRVIARTEALRSVHEGNDEMYQQAFDTGDLSPDEVTQTWITARDERVRRSHAAMHGQQQPVGQPFRSGNGYLLMYPGDGSAPASETVQCRCSVTTRIGPLSNEGDTANE